MKNGNIFISLICFLFPLVIFSQSTTVEINTDSVYRFVNQPPEFPGGDSGCNNYLRNTLVYPEQALADSIEGKVYVEFVVETDGSISNVKIIRGIGGDCDEEVLRIISDMPAWAPGKLNGIPVRVSKTLPVNFRFTIPPPSQTKIYLDVDTLPSFPEGLVELKKFINNNIEVAEIHDHFKDSTIVNVYFVVETDGRISNVTAPDSVCFGCNEEAVKLVQKMPKWKPGIQWGKTVRVSYNLPIKFSLN